MSDSPLTPELADLIAKELKRLYGELAKVNAQPTQQAEVLSGICTQLNAYQTLLSFFVMAKQTEHMSNLVKHSERLVKLTWAIVILTFGLLFFTVVLYQNARAQIQRDKAAEHSSVEQK
jgi:hypothetical protein